MKVIGLGLMQSHCGRRLTQPWGGRGRTQGAGPGAVGGPRPLGRPPRGGVQRGPRGGAAGGQRGPGGAHRGPQNRGPVGRGALAELWSSAINRYSSGSPLPQQHLKPIHQTLSAEGSICLLTEIPKLRGSRSFHLLNLAFFIL